jgi:Raf kinase inhibitor-like YbhB/YbcL family protein
MRIESPSFKNGESIPSKFTCDGDNTSPELRIFDVPEKAQSLVLIMDDPDIPEIAKTTYGITEWEHWLVFNIPANTSSISEGQNPEGIVAKNTRGNNAYGSPCPPDREHRYFFKLLCFGQYARYSTKLK